MSISSVEQALQSLRSQHRNSAWLRFAGLSYDQDTGMSIGVYVDKDKKELIDIPQTWMGWPVKIHLV